MRARLTPRGFVRLEHHGVSGGPVRLAQESSHAECKLWVGEECELDKDQVKELIGRLRHWMKTGRLEVDMEA